MASVKCTVVLTLLMFTDLHAITRAQSPTRFIGVMCDRLNWNFELQATVKVALRTVRELNISLELDARVEPLPPQDALEAGQTACDLMRTYGMAGVVAPYNSASLRHVQAACDQLDVPLLITHAVGVAASSWTAVNLFPHYSAITEAVIELVKQKGWTRFTIVYEESEALERLYDVLALHSEAVEYQVSARQLPATDNYRSLLLNLKNMGSENFVVDCRSSSAAKLLEQAQQVGIVSEPYAYIFTHPDLQTIDLDIYSHGGANITGFRIFDVSSPMIVNFTRDLKEEYEEYFDRVGSLMPDHVEFSPEKLPSAFPLTVDAILLAASALQKINAVQPSSLDCDTGAALEFGSTLVNHMRTIKMEGLTGTIQFDEDGDRSEILLEVVELLEGGVLTKVGNWSKTGISKKDRDEGLTTLIIDRPPEKEIPDETDSMKNKTFIVLISLTPPYGMRRESTGKLDGNERYEGFCVELIDELSKILGFNYIFEVQEDGKYGNFNATTGQWDGMLSKVMNGSVHFAITDLTITAEREAAVDFTTPFMNLGISILFSKPDKPGPNSFAFLKPFSNGVWFSLGGVYLGCSVLLYLLGRVCPDEWQNPYPCMEEPAALENQFTLANALWFNLGAVLLQGSEIAPVAYGTRAVASMWWFFALIITSSYTANLASMLAMPQKFQPIHSAEDLYDNPYNISYGAKEGGSTFSFFQGSKNDLFRKMYEYMAAHPENNVNSNDNGTKRVLEGNYAFLMESTSIEYLVERQCDLVQVGGLLDNKGYGLAMKKESVYRQKLNLALLNLQEQGKLTAMKKKWWMEKRGGGVCVKSEETASDDLELANVSGVFIVLVTGCALGVLVSFLDMTWHVFRRSRQYETPFLAEFVGELKFVFNFNATEKPLRRRRSPSETESLRALTTSQSPQSTPERDGGAGSPSLSPERAADSAPGSSPEHRHSAHKPASRRASGRSARRRSTIHNTSVRLARQHTKE